MSLSVNIRSRTSRTKTSRTTVNVGQNTRRPKHCVEQHDVEQQPPHPKNYLPWLLGQSSNETVYFL